MTSALVALAKDKNKAKSRVEVLNWRHIIPRRALLKQADTDWANKPSKKLDKAGP